MTAYPIRHQNQPESSSLLQPLNPEQIQKVIDLLDSWCNVSQEEAEEQRETWEYLKKALDEDRLSYRKLFP